MRRAAVAVLCLVQFVDVLGVTSAVTAIPAILHGLHADPAWAGPIATTYAMFFAGTLVLGARLGDRFGHRRILLIGLVAFAVVSVVGGTAGSMPQVLIGRAIQGTAAALSAPAALRLLLAAAPGARARTNALAAWSATGAAAGTGGFLAGGLLTQSLGWPFVFWINAPVGALLIAGVVVAVRGERPETGRPALDILGAGLLVASLMPVVAGAALLERSPTRALGAGLLALGAAVALAFVWRMRSAAHPLIPPAAVASAELRRGTVQSFVNTATTSSSAVLATLLLQDRLRLTPLISGLTLMLLSLAVVIGSILTGPLAARLGGDRLGALGLGIVAAGDAELALTAGTWWGIAVGAVLLGAGLAPASVAANDVGTTVHDALTGSAAGILNTGAQLGTALGTAALVLVASLAGTAVAWAVAGAGALGCAAWCLLRRRSGAVPGGVSAPAARR